MELLRGINKNGSRKYPRKDYSAMTFATLTFLSPENDNTARGHEGWKNDWDFMSDQYGHERDVYIDTSVGMIIGLVLMAVALLVKNDQWRMSANWGTGLMMLSVLATIVIASIVFICPGADTKKILYNEPDAEDIDQFVAMDISTYDHESHLGTNSYIHFEYICLFAIPILPLILLSCASCVGPCEGLKKCLDRGNTNNRNTTNKFDPYFRQYDYPPMYDPRYEPMYDDNEMQYQSEYNSHQTMSDDDFVDVLVVDEDEQSSDEFNLSELLNPTKKKKRKHRKHRKKQPYISYCDDDETPCDCECHHDDEEDICHVCNKKRRPDENPILSMADEITKLRREKKGLSDKLDMQKRETQNEMSELMKEHMKRLEGEKSAAQEVLFMNNQAYDDLKKELDEKERELQEKEREKERELQEKERELQEKKRLERERSEKEKEMRGRMANAKEHKCGCLSNNKDYMYGKHIILMCEHDYCCTSRKATYTDITNASNPSILKFVRQHNEAHIKGDVVDKELHHFHLQQGSIADGSVDPSPKWSIAIMPHAQFEIYNKCMLPAGTYDCEFFNPSNLLVISKQMKNLHTRMKAQHEKEKATRRKALASHKRQKQGELSDDDEFSKVPPKQKQGSRFSMKGKNKGKKKNQNQENGISELRLGYDDDFMT